MAETPNQSILIVIQTLATVLFFMVAGMFLRRKVRSEYRRPTVMFGVWWALGGFLMGIGIIRTILLEYGISIRIPLSYVTLIFLPIALFALLYYTLFLFTGKERWAIPIGVFYGAIVVALVAIAVWSEPYLDIETGKVAYVHQDLASYTGMITIFAVTLPQIFVCIALYALYFKLDKPTQKYRIFMIATGIFIWVCSSLVASIFKFSSSIPIWPIISNAILVLTGLMAYAAYNPPGFFKKKYGIQSIDDELPSSNRAEDE